LHCRKQEHTQSKPLTQLCTVVTTVMMPQKLF